MIPFELLNGQLGGIRFGQGRKILAFHGFLDNAMTFKLLADALPGFEIWSLELPGHGCSAPLPELDGTFLLNWLPTLGRALDELDWAEYRVLGHSLGAVISQLLAGVDSRISQLLSLDALGPIVSEQSENLERFQRIYDNRRKCFPMRYYDSYAALVDSRLQGTFPLSPSAASVMAKRAVGYSQQGWYHRYDRRLRQESLWRLSEADAQAWLARIQCPVSLALFNAHLWPSYQTVMEERKAAIPRLSTSVLSGSHHLHLESPDVVAQWVNEQWLGD
ncbi:alpha/beta fold hydrolase [Reinekea sp. G2M2-21]|uniref:alpha/beta fold hydrolase n=1 Tax=Reinekea sp. G2M2-21 TaxID=2788942 RepID=UPI0018AB3191|nr:alpha/beta hydrolase [Reinekea sp. G2M2-21]